MRQSLEDNSMIKAFTIALGLAFAAPLALSTAALAEDNMRHDGAGMHGDMHKDKMASNHRDTRHHAVHAKGRGDTDREEAKVTVQLNQHELGDNRTR
jgi:pentapeptide MXKDX repeat protein